MRFFAQANKLLKKCPAAISTVTPAQAGVQITNDILDSGLRRNDGLLTTGEVFQQSADRLIRKKSRTPRV